MARAELAQTAHSRHVTLCAGFNVPQDPNVDVCCWFSGNMTRVSSPLRRVGRSAVV